MQTATHLLTILRIRYLSRSYESVFPLWLSSAFTLGLFAQYKHNTSNHPPHLPPNTLQHPPTHPKQPPTNRFRILKSYIFNRSSGLLGTAGQWDLIVFPLASALLYTITHVHACICTHLLELRLTYLHIDIS